MCDTKEEELKRLVKFMPAWDKRDPDPRKDYGIHGVDLVMVLKGKKGAVHFLLFTGWLLPENEKAGRTHWEPLPVDVGYHALAPQWSGQEVGEGKCEYLDGRPCYCEGSGLAAQRMFEVLLREGSDGVWRELEVCYRNRFSKS